MTNQFRGVLHFSSGTGQANRAYLFSRDGAGKFSLAAAAKVDFDSAQPFIAVSTGAATHLQFAVDTGASNLGQSNFGTLASTGGESCSGGLLEVTFSSGRVVLYIVRAGFGFYNGTDKLFFTLSCDIGVSP